MDGNFCLTYSKIKLRKTSSYYFFLYIVLGALPAFNGTYFIFIKKQDPGPMKKFLWVLAAITFPIVITWIAMRDWPITYEFGPTGILVFRGKICQRRIPWEQITGVDIYWTGKYKEFVISTTIQNEINIILPPFSRSKLCSLCTIFKMNVKPEVISKDFLRRYQDKST